MQAECGHYFIVATLIDRGKVWDSVTLAIVRDDLVDQRNEEVFNVLGPFKGEVRAEWIQNEQIFFWSVEQRLGEHHYHESQQHNSVLVELSFVMVQSFWH